MPGHLPGGVDGMASSGIVRYIACIFSSRRGLPRPEFSAWTPGSMEVF